MATSRRYSLRCTLALLLSGLACQALAEPPTADSGNNGLMTFKHARVVNAPPVASEQPATTASEVRAYLDPETGELRAPTAEEARQLSNSATTATRLSPRANSVATAATNEEQLIYGPGNTVGLVLGEESMVFQMAQVDADGNLIQQCVTGEDEAAHALHSAATQDHTQQESRNDR